MHAQYEDRVAFFVVYIREAHPEDGWVRFRPAELAAAIERELPARP